MISEKDAPAATLVEPGADSKSGAVPGGSLRAGADAHAQRDARRSASERLDAGAWLFGMLQRVLPQHAISRLVYRVARSRRPGFKNLLIRAFCRAYAPDLSDAVVGEPTRYESFNAFFTRALREGARPCPVEAQALASPVDGAISEVGRIRSDRLLQAKGHEYTLAALLAAREPWVESFRDGHFATIYLAPWNYHRIHMCTAGTLADAWYVPGRLFSVNSATARAIPRLFARNERVILGFEDGALRHAIALIGALNVGSMETVWHGEVTPRRRSAPTTLRLPRPGPSPHAPRGAELGRFNMGSTVILLFPRDTIRWSEDLVPGRLVRVGEAIGERLVPVSRRDAAV